MSDISYVATLAFAGFILWVAASLGMEWWKESRALDKESMQGQINQLRTEINQLAMAVGLKKKMDPAMQAQLQAMQNVGLR